MYCFVVRLWHLVGLLLDLGAMIAIAIKIFSKKERLKCSKT